MTCIKPQSEAQVCVLPGLANVGASSTKNILAQIQIQEQKERDEESKALNGSAGNENSVGGNYIPMSMAAGIIAAFLLMITYGNLINQQQNELSQTWAKAMMGEKTDASGNVTIDIKNSIAGQWYNNSVAAGTAQAAGLFAQAIGNIVSGCAGLASLGATFGAYKSTISSPTKDLDPQLAGAKAYKNLLENRRGADLVARAENGPGSTEMTPMGSSRLSADDELSDAAAARRDQMEAGNMIDRYRPDSNSNVDFDSDATREAAGHLSDEGLNKAMKSANKQVASLEGQKGGFSQNFQSATNIINMANTVGQSGGQAYGNIVQSSNTAIQAQDKATSDTAQQNMQIMQGSVDKATQNAQSNHESANSMATAMGQTLQATNR